MPLILDGKAASAEIKDRLQKKVESFRETPALAIIQVGERKESSAYIERKKAFGKAIGARVLHLQLPESASEKDCLSTIQKLNIDQSIHGIILQLPLPNGKHPQEFLDAIALEKDVDGLHSKNTTFIPATARGVLSLLNFYRISVEGKKVAVLGRSALVGAPTAKAMEQAGATVTVCHSQTPNTKDVTLSSDIIVAAIGKPRLIGREYVRSDKTQVVVDVGITSVTERGLERLQEEIPKRRLVGDVDFEAVRDFVAAISPVPGGVGPMTVAALFENLVSAYERQARE